MQEYYESVAEKLTDQMENGSISVQRFSDLESLENAVARGGPGVMAVMSEAHGLIDRTTGEFTGKVRIGGEEIDQVDFAKSSEKNLPVGALLTLNYCSALGLSDIYKGRDKFKYLLKQKGLLK